MVELEARDLPLDDADRLQFFAVVDDDGTGTGAHSECNEENNVGTPVDFQCVLFL